MGCQEGSTGLRRRRGKVGPRMPPLWAPMAISNRNIVRAPQKRHLGGQDARSASGPVPLDFDGEFTFTSWAGSIIQLVLKSGTCFSHFLAKTSHLQRSEGHPAPTALFPLPVRGPNRGDFLQTWRRPYSMKQPCIPWLWLSLISMFQNCVLLRCSLWLFRS